MKNISIGMLIMITTLNSYAQNMKKVYENAVLTEIEKINTIDSSILSEEEMAHLPDIVQKYLRFVGAVGREKVSTFRAECKGVIRNDPNKAFMNINSVQYNFYKNAPARLFYIEAKKGGIKAKVAHIYQNETATMKGKLLGLFTIVDAKGTEANQAETVTVFNDICVLAPALLISNNIEWKVIDNLTVKAKYTNNNISIEAQLHFDEDGKLINFTSNDRYETKDGRVFSNYPWETPVLEYKDINGYYLPSKVKAIFKRPDGDFFYGEFEVLRIEYNCIDLK